MRTLLIAFILTFISNADTITKKDKTTLYGDIVKIELDKFYLRTESGSIKKIKKEEIVDIQIDDRSKRYIRFSRINSTRSILEVKRQTFKKNKKNITLYPAIHIADKVFFKNTEEEMNKKDIILYEGICAKEPIRINLSIWKLPAKEIRMKPYFIPKNRNKGTVARIQEEVGKKIDLSYQLEEINYYRLHWWNSDVTQQELVKIYMKNGFVPTVNDNTKIINIIKPAFTTSLRIMMGYDPITSYKEGFAIYLSEFRDYNSLMYKTLVISRNDFAWKKLNQCLNNEMLNDIGIFYGALHMKDFEKRLKYIGFIEDKAEWVTAWEINF